MKTKSDKWLIGILFLGQVLVFIGVVLSSNFYYQTNDDTTIVALASGAYGQPSIYLDNIHVFLSYIFKWLFTNFPIVNWITIFFVIVLFISFFSIDYIVVKLLDKKNIANYLAVFAIVEICWFMIVSYFTFTIVAYACGIAALLSWIYILFIPKAKKYSWINGFLLMFICTMIRAEVLKSLILVSCLLLVYWGYKNKKIFSSLFIIVIPLLMMFSMTWVHECIYSMNDIQKEFWDWGEIRSEAVDCAPVAYDTHEKEFNNIGVDYNIYQMIYNQYYFDYEAVNKDIFLNLKEMNSTSEKYNFNFLEIFKTIVGINNGILYYEQFYRILLLMVLIFALINCKKKIIEFLLIALSTLGVTWLFYFINRPVYRVIMPNYLFAVLLIITLCIKREDTYEDDCNLKYNNILRNISLFGIYILPFVTVISFSYYNPIHEIDKMTRHNVERRMIYKYLEENEDKLYLSGNLSVYSIDVCRPVLEFAGQNALWNLIGNWETFSVPYYQLLEHYDIENPDRLVLELPNSDVLRIISNQGLGYIEFASFFDSYIENETNRTVEIVPEEYIATLPDGEWWSFRVVYTD